MKTTYLKEYEGYLAKKVAFIPMGTLEWHGNHLPIETDFLVAQKLCEILAKKKGAYILPPIYLGTDSWKKIKNKKLFGMDAALEKELPGSVYYLEPNLLSSIMQSSVDNLLKQGFNKIYIVLGHTDKNQEEVFKMLEKKNKNVIILNPYKDVSIHVHHADEYETSLLWACYPEEEAKSRRIKIKSKDDYFKYKGYDPRKKASLKLGRRLLNEIISTLSKKIK